MKIISQLLDGNTMQSIGLAVALIPDEVYEQEIPIIGKEYTYIPSMKGKYLDRDGERVKSIRVKRVGKGWDWRIWGYSDTEASPLN